MKTLSILVDFSLPSNHAAIYAAELCNDRGYNRIILVANCYISQFEQIIPTPDLLQVGKDEIGRRTEATTRRAKSLRTRLLKILSPGITVDYLIDDKPLLRSVYELSLKEDFNLLVIGSNSDENEQESFIGSNLIEIAKIAAVPVLIVPARSHYQPVKNALLPCNLDSFNQVSLLSRLQKIKDWQHPKLFLLSVMPKNDPLPESEPVFQFIEPAKKLLSNYEYVLAHVSQRNILTGIMHFAKKNDIQIIIALPGSHSFLYRLTHSSITKGLAQNAKLPVLILK